MKLDRFRAPALAAVAVLLISGAGIAFAGSPSPSAPVSQASQVEPVGPDTDTLQAGDQTTPDVAGAAESTTEAAGTEAAGAAESTTEAAGTETAGTEAAGTEADGPGGHADPAGQNVDHQFDGEE